MLDLISVFLNLLRLVFVAHHVVYPGKCAMYTWKNVYSATFGWNVLSVSIKSIWYNVSFKAYVSLLIFYLNDLSIDAS